MEPKGRNFYNPLVQFPRLGNLLRRLGVESSTVLLLLNLIPAFAVLSCQPERVPVAFEVIEEDEPEAEVTPYSSVVFDYFTKCKLEDFKIKTLDIFIYDTEGVKALEEHQTLTGGDIPRQGHLELRLPSASPRTVVLIANCPKALNDEAVARFDSMELLEFAFEDEDTGAPVLCGVSQGETPQIELAPLLSRVVLAAVTNGLADYELLEEPSVRLCDITPSARALQKVDFRPAETIAVGKTVALPCDVGFHTQHPDISLFCYPNDTPETSLGAPRTSLEFQCKIKGVECSFPVDLPPVGRNSVTRIELIINGVRDYERIIL